MRRESESLERKLLRHIMNIFATHPSALISAMWLDDTTKLKTVRTAAQALSHIIKELDPRGYRNYSLADNSKVKTTPSIDWAKSSFKNASWLGSYAMQSYRDLADHKYPGRSELFECFRWLVDPQKQRLFEQQELLPFANNTENRFKRLNFTEEEDTCEAYRMFLSGLWKAEKAPPTWNLGRKPIWYEKDN